MLSQNTLKGLLRYDGYTGLFYWRNDAGGHGEIKAGSVAGWIKPNGYRYVFVAGKVRQTSHLAWLYVHGYLPPKGMEMDHMDRVRSNDRIANLRIATKAQNGRNKDRQKNNTSGYKGVSWDSSKRRWVAMITADRHQKMLGRFVDIKDAIAAREHAVATLHREFAPASTPRHSFPQDFICHIVRDRSGLSGMRIAG